jgi:hypothetical protein
LNQWRCSWLPEATHLESQTVDGNDSNTVTDPEFVCRLGVPGRTLCTHAKQVAVSAYDLAGTV